jgi:RimJ/RimL family protein N-acetyltransferase
MLRGERVQVRAVELADLPSLHDWWADPAHWHEMAEPARLLSFEAVEDWYDAERDRVDLQEGRTLAIADSAGGILGTIQYGRIDPRDRACEIGMFLGKGEDRGKGYGSEALRLLLAFLFGDLGVHRASLQVHPDNAAAIRCYEKMGFASEGRLRQCRFFDGRFHDMLVMALLASELKGV